MYGIPYWKQIKKPKRKTKTKTTNDRFKCLLKDGSLVNKFSPNISWYNQVKMSSKAVQVHYQESKTTPFTFGHQLSVCMCVCVVHSLLRSLILGNADTHNKSRKKTCERERKKKTRLTFRWIMNKWYGIDLKPFFRFRLVMTWNWCGWKNRSNGRTFNYVQFKSIEFPNGHINVNEIKFKSTVRHTHIETDSHICT